MKTQVEKNKEIGNRLYKLRKDAGLTQEQLVDALNELMNGKGHVSIQSVSAWEHRGVVPRADVFNALRVFFNVSAEFILNGTDTPAY